MRRTARLLVRMTSPLVPRYSRRRWREEWLGELAASRSATDAMRRACGAPVDALLLRRQSAHATLRSLVSGLKSDAVLTIRALVRSPRHVLTVVGCLGVGLTAAITVFSIVNSLLYGEIPGIEDRRSLARVFIAHDNVVGQENVGRAGVTAASALSRRDFDVVERHPDPVFTGWAAEGDLTFAIAMGDAALTTSGAFVSPDYFTVLGTRPAVGRLLTRRDADATAPPAAVIGYHLWRERLGGRDEVVGQTLLVGARQFTIVGVAPARFTGLQPADVGASPLDYTQLWLPARDAAGWPGAPGADEAWFTVRARVAPGLTVDEVRPNLDAMAAHIAVAYPLERRNARFVLSSYGFGPNDSPLDVLLIIGLFLAVPLSVLAIACANVANLQLARATERTRELAVRTALGASRAQIVRLLALDAAALASIATAAGWAGTSITIAAVGRLFPLTIALDVHVLAFALSLAAAITLLSGLAPAWLVSRRSTSALLNQSARAGGLLHSRLRNALVVAQLAGSLVLLVAAGLFGESVRAMRAGAPAELSEQLLLPVNLESIGYTPSQSRRTVEALQTRVATDARVRAVAVESLGGFRYRVVGDAAGEPHYSAGGFVSPSWFDASAARFVAGRPFSAAEGDAAVVVTARMARQIAADGDAVGRAIEIASAADRPPAIATIVGVLADRPRRPDDPNPDAAIYANLPSASPTSLVLRIRTNTPDALGADLKPIVRGIDARLPWTPPETAAEVYLRDVGPIRYTALSVAAFGALALGLAGVGLFAVMAYVVSLRRHEIGVRVAIGASRGDVVRLVLRQSARLTTTGLAAGLLFAIPMSFVIRATFVGVTPVSPLAFGPAVALLLAAGLAAAIVPARRAASMNPIDALRAD
jgi:predicted permease